MICLGSRTCRFQGTRESAWEIINRLSFEGSRQRHASLQIQQEMLGHGLPLHKTTAARTLLRSLTQLAGGFKKSWAKLRKARRTTSPREPSSGFRSHTFLGRSSTNRSSSSETSWSVVSSAGASRNSTPPFSPAGSASSAHSAYGRGDTLIATIRVLRLAHQMADIAHVPILRGVIGTVLHIAQLIEVSTPLLTARCGS